MKGKDKGFSLVELIVVIAIMAVATTVSGYALSTISLANAKNCATEIKSKLELARMETLTAVNEEAQSVWLYQENGNVYLSVGDGEAKKIGNSNVTVTCDGATLPNKDNAICFSYNKSTGAFDTFAGKTIKVTGASREYTITLYAKTGKIKME